ncbi:MAG: endonuclease/exonuclease/phosphatase family protein [Bacteroidia bacterium]|nr:endonuclease/exonuclease/phosphatase family protein [Bacteroidia bacterium]
MFSNYRLWLFIPSIILILSASSCPPSAEQTADSSLRLITHNVYYGFTKKPERKTQWLAWMQAQKPDIVCLQELNEYTPEQLQEEATSWGHAYSVLLKENGFPTGITSRYPLEDIVRTEEGFHHGLIRVKIRDMYLYCIHLHPSNWEFRIREMEKILADIATLPDDAPVMLAGDFNTFSLHDSIYYAHGLLEPFFAGLDSANAQAKNLREGKLDYTPLALLEAAGFTDMEHSFRGEDYTFTGTFPGLLVKEENHGARRRLDYIFVNDVLHSRVRRAEIIANDTTEVVSDHLPVVVDVE